MVDRKPFSRISHLHQDQGCGPPTGGGSISYSLALALASPLSAVACSCNCPAAVGNAHRASCSHSVCAECKYGNRAGISVTFGLCSFIALVTCWRMFSDQLQLHANLHRASAGGQWNVQVAYFLEVCTSTGFQHHVLGDEVGLVMRT